MIRRVWAVLTWAWFTALCLSCGSADDAGQQTTEVNASDSVVIELAGVDSLSVLELLKAAHAVDYTVSSMGAFVKSIDSIENSSSYYWLYSVNDSMGQVACDRYLTDSGDIVRWHFRKVGQ